MKKINICSVIIFLIISFIQMVHAHSETQKSENGETMILNEINAYRAKEGLSQLKVNSFIAEQARQHSREMADRSIPFGHDRFGERKEKILAKYSDGCYAIAENVACSDSGLKRIVPLWLHSPGHRKNIEGNFGLTGVGVVRDNHGRVYVTQIFLRA